MHTCVVFMAFATICRHQRKPVFPPEQQLGTRQPLYPKRQPAAAVPPLRTGCAPACADFQPRSLRLSLRRRGDEYFIRLYFCDDDTQRLRQRGACLFGQHLSVDVCHEFGRRAAIGRTIFQFERHRTTDRSRRNGTSKPELEKCRLNTLQTALSSDNVKLHHIRPPVRKLGKQILNRGFRLQTNALNQALLRLILHFNNLLVFKRFHNMDDRTALLPRYIHPLYLGIP